MKKAILLLCLLAPVASGLVATEKKKTVVLPELQQEIIGYIPEGDVPEKTPISKITNLLLEIRRFEDREEQIVFEGPDSFDSRLNMAIGTEEKLLGELRALYENLKRSGENVSSIRMPQGLRYDVHFQPSKDKIGPLDEFLGVEILKWTDTHFKKLVDTFGPRIVSMVIDGQFLTSKTIDLIAKCRNLKKLDITIEGGGQCKLFDTEKSTIATLKRLPKSLEEISLSVFYFSKKDQDRYRKEMWEFSKKDGDKLLEKVKKDLPNIKEIVVYPNEKH